VLLNPLQTLCASQLAVQLQQPAAAAATAEAASSRSLLAAPKAWLQASPMSCSQSQTVDHHEAVFACLWGLSEGPGAGGCIAAGGWEPPAAVSCLPLASCQLTVDGYIRAGHRWAIKADWWDPGVCLVRATYPEAWAALLL
jgi:hypothetical protein